jgi:DNA-binding transcriptional LysR family regulator
LSFGQRHVLPILDRYLKLWPELRADIRFTDRFVDLVEEGVDVAVRIGAPKEDSQLLTRTVAWQQFVTCAAPDYLQRHGTPQVPADLYGHDKIAFLAGEKSSPGVFAPTRGCTCARNPGG